MVRTSRRIAELWREHTVPWQLARRTPTSPHKTASFRFDVPNAVRDAIGQSVQPASPW
jgi:hypothetical protein